MRWTSLAVILFVVHWPMTGQAAYPETFPAGSLIVPMDRAYQTDAGLLQAYGLLFQLLRQGMTVYWIIEPTKTWHAKACNDLVDPCPWDCGEEGSGVKCAYPTASPDFYVGASVLWNSAGQHLPGATIALHGYRGGPFVIDSYDAAAAAAIVDAWNTQSQPWAQRSTFAVVAAHVANAAFDVKVTKEMLAAPTIAVFADGNENIATGYLRAAGIKQSNGSEFPAAKCGAGNPPTPCGPGTANPDMLTVPSIMGDMGTCTSPNYDHKNGALFTTDGVPAYCQIMSMHWDVADRNTVECNGGACGTSQSVCGNKTITYHGHEVIAEVRSFLNYPTHLFAECQAVNAYENLIPNPAWPFLDDPERIGHFLTTVGTWPTCLSGNTCPAGQDTKGGVQCVVGGCDNGTRNCCLPKDAKEQGLGFAIGGTPASADVQVFHPEVAYNQLDGAFKTTGGSEPSYNLSTYFETEYKNDMDITFITGPDGPGDEDIWMTGYLDGICRIYEEGGDQCEGVGKVSYLGGHSYKDMTAGTRLFLNALFEADCVTSVGQPDFYLDLLGDATIVATSLPVQRTYAADYYNWGLGAALDTQASLLLPPSVSPAAYEQPGTVNASGDIEWEIGTVGTYFGMAGDPEYSGSRWATVSFSQEGQHVVEFQLQYRVGVSVRQAPPGRINVTVVLDSDSDGVPDSQEPPGCELNPGCCGDQNGDGCDDCAPNVDTDGDGVCDSGDSDPNNRYVCSDRDGDTCEDCTAGSFQPANDGEDLDGDGLCDAGDPDIDGDGIDNASDAAPTDPTVCGDTDSDGCEDCVSGAFNHANDGPDTDGDGICNLGDSDDDGDGMPDTSDLCPTGETGWTSSLSTDNDGDGCRDATEDNDDDNDGITDGSDLAPLDPHVCGDSDSDGCEDCVSGVFDPANDGPDTDGDGICDASDPEINDRYVCGDSDGDTCDDCFVAGAFAPMDDGVDTDGDGSCDAGDLDDDDDGVTDSLDLASLDPYICGDSDGDTCDDCAIVGGLDPDNDGTDGDLDGECDQGDLDDDNDGVLDTSDLCPTGETGWTSNSSTDADVDGCRDATEDLDDDNDGVLDIDDSSPTDPYACGDGDGDTCDDCAVMGLAAPGNDGPDADGDGLCDVGDLDDDNDGVPDVNDLCPTGEMEWTSSPTTDVDGDGCRDETEDQDDDNDGFGDVDETSCGSDPASATSTCDNRSGEAYIARGSCGCRQNGSGEAFTWLLAVFCAWSTRRSRQRDAKH